MADSLEEESVSSSPLFSEEEEESVSILPDVSKEESASEEEVGQASGPEPETIGYWDHTWLPTRKTGPKGQNMNIIFSGRVDLKKILNKAYEPYFASKPPLAGIDNYFSLGGGNSNGIFTQRAIDQLIKDLGAIKKMGYVGISYDIEKCDSYLKFGSAFKATKDAGLKVLVTVSHSAPFGCPNAVQMTRDLIKDPNVDYMSPQLYSSGHEPKPDFSLTWVARDLKWCEYAGQNYKFVPSIGRASHYPAVQKYFRNKCNLKCDGYIQWVQSGTVINTPTAKRTKPDHKPSNPTPAENVVHTTFRCGKDWYDANNNCHGYCASGKDRECKNGLKCFSDLEKPCGTSKPVESKNRCGYSWEHASDNCFGFCPNAVDSECKNGMKCFGNLRGSLRCDPSYRCGKGPTPSKAWYDANNTCHDYCPSGKDSECPGTMQCFANLKKIPGCEMKPVKDSFKWIIKSEFPTCAKCGQKLESVSRIVHCQGADKTVDASGQKCSGGHKPHSSKTCLKTPECKKKITYQWVNKTEFACPFQCGQEATPVKRDVECVGSDSSVDTTGKKCKAEEKPHTSMLCKKTKACPIKVDYRWAWTTDFPACTCACGKETKVVKRIVLCRGSDKSIDPTGASCKTEKPATSMDCPKCPENKDCNQPGPRQPKKKQGKWKVVGEWSPRHCPKSCGHSASKQSRSVICVDNDGAKVEASLCTGDRPAAEQTCAATKQCVTYDWVAENFAQCPSSCTNASTTLTRVVRCKGSDGTISHSKCSAGSKPDVTKTCRCVKKTSWSKLPKKCCAVGHHTKCGVGGSLIGNACKHSNTSHDQCKKKCASASWCKFFEYPRSHSTCWLFHECTKVNDCSGYDTYNKVVRHVSLTGGKWKVVGEWSPRHCPKDCGQSASKQRRSVICVDADGEKVEDGFCTNVKLATERTCKATKQCVFTKQADQCCTIAGTTCGPDGSLKGNRCFYGVMPRRKCKRKCSGYAWCKQMVYSNDGQQKCYLENSCMNVKDNCKFDRFLKGSDYNENAATVQPYNFTKHANQCCTTAATKCGPGGSVKGKSCNYHSMTLHQCQKKCTSKSWCKHVEYGSDNQNCWLYHSCGHVKKCTSFDTFAKGEGYVAPKRSFALPIPKPRNIIRNFYDMLSKKFTKHSKQCCVASATTCGTDGSSAGSSCYAGVMSLGKCQAKCKGKSWCNHVVYSNTGSNKCWLEHSCTANLTQCTSYDRFIRKDRDHQSRLFTKRSNKCCHASATYCGWPHRSHKGSQCYKGRMTLAKCTEMCTNNFWCKSAVFHREKNYCWLESECANPINYCQKFDRYVKKPRGSSTSEMNEMEESVSVAYADDGKFE